MLPWKSGEVNELLILQLSGMWSESGIYKIQSKISNYLILKLCFKLPLVGGNALVTLFKGFCWVIYLSAVLRMEVCALYGIE